jgi:hypothetical protein
MKASDIYSRLRKIHERTFRLDHTSFASRKNGDDGFHVFIGREVFDEGHECFVTLDAVAGTSYTTLDQAVRDLCNAAEKGRRYYYQKVQEGGSILQIDPPLHQEHTSHLMNIKRRK